MCFLAPDAMLGSTNRKCLRIYIAIPICTFFLTQQIGTNLHYACKNQWTLPWKVQALRESCNLDATVTFTPWRNPALMALHSRNVQGNLTKFWWSNTNSRKVKHKGKFARPIAHRSLHCARMVLVKVPLFKEKTDNLWPNFEWNPISLKKMQIKICQTTVFAWWAESWLKSRLGTTKIKFSDFFTLCGCHSLSRFPAWKVFLPPARLEPVRGGVVGMFFSPKPIQFGVPKHG